MRIGTVDGVEAELAGVTVDNFVHLHLTAAQDDNRDQLTREYDDAFEQWATTATEDRGDVPEEPAHRLMRVRTLVSDNRGNAYHPHGGEYGGSGTQWDAIQSFVPRPPDDVRELQISLQTPMGSSISLSVPLS